MNTLDDVEARVLGDKPRTDRDIAYDDAISATAVARVPRATPLLGAGGEEETKTMDAEDFGGVSAPLMTATASGNPFRGAVDVEPDDELARAIGAQSSRLRAFEARAGGMPEGNLRFRQIPDDVRREIVGSSRATATTRTDEPTAIPEPVRRPEAVPSGVSYSKLLKDELRGAGLATTGTVGEMEMRLRREGIPLPGKPAETRGRKRGGRGK